MWKLSQVILLSLALVDSQKNEDDGRPYEFGFTIDGEQHRYEKKDEKGIVQGEFGFITADGIYHVTVYATDENGDFKILSMRNLRISAPLDGSPFKGEISPEANKYRKQAGLALLPDPSPNPLSVPESAPKQSLNIQSTTSRAPYVFTTQSTIKPACAGCGYVTTQKSVPGQKFQFQNPIFQQQDRDISQKNSISQQTPPETLPTGVGGIQASQKPQYQSTKDFQNTQYSSVEKGQPNRGSSAGGQLSSRFGSSTADISGHKFGIAGSQPPQQSNGNVNGQQAQQFTEGSDTSGLPGPSLFSNQPNPQQGSGETQLGIGHSPSTQQQPTANKNEPASNPLSLPNPDDVRQQVQQEVKDFVGVGNQGSGSKQSGLPPIAVSNDVIHVGGKNPQDIPIKDKFPGMEDGLPQGIEETDIKNILYKFHYTVGFHGHYEKGLKNGAKIGGYFVNGRDGISRVVTYIADENGYRPKVKLINLGLDSDETPKEATEKSFGLKSFEFVWYPIE